MEIIEPSIFQDRKVTALFTTVDRKDALTVHASDFGRSDELHKSEIQKNYADLFTEAGLNEHSIALAKQVHGKRVEIVSEPGVYKQCDGLVTRLKGLVLGIRVADCAAILLADDNAGIITAIHAGWRGAEAGILPEGLKKMRSLGADPDQISAYVSPCISKARFEVGEEVAQQFPDRFADRKSYDKPHIDIKGYLLSQLEEFGVKRSRIELSHECTMGDSKFFSYRRERESAGRMLALIVLNQ